MDISLIFPSIISINVLKHFLKPLSNVKVCFIGFWTSGNDIASEGNWVWTMNKSNNW